MSFAIMRMQKIKSRVSVLRSVQHDTRERQPNNADPERTINNITDKSITTEKAMQKYTDMLPEKVRKNAVHAVEVVCTASPDFKGDWDNYLIMAKKWADTKLGGEQNCLHWSIHLDEKTPHLHAVYMPLVAGKLNAKELIGGSRDRMRELQTDFYQNVGKKYELQRGIENGHAHHSAIKNFPAIMTKEQEKKNLEIEKKAEKLHEWQNDIARREKNLNKNLSNMTEIALESYREKTGNKKNEISKPRLFEFPANYLMRITPEIDKKFSEEKAQHNNQIIAFKKANEEFHKQNTDLREQVQRDRSKSETLEKELGHTQKIVQAWRQKTPDELRDVAQKVEISKSRNVAEYLEYLDLVKKQQKSKEQGRELSR